MVQNPTHGRDCVKTPLRLRETLRLCAKRRLQDRSRAKTQKTRKDALHDPPTARESPFYRTFITPAMSLPCFSPWKVQ